MAKGSKGAGRCKLDSTYSAKDRDAGRQASLHLVWTGHQAVATVIERLAFVTLALLATSHLSDLSGCALCMRSANLGVSRGRYCETKKGSATGPQKSHAHFNDFNDALGDVPLDVIRHTAPIESAQSEGFRHHVFVRLNSPFHLKRGSAEAQPTFWQARGPRARSPVRDELAT